MDSRFVAKFSENGCWEVTAKSSHLYDKKTSASAECIPTPDFAPTSPIASKISQTLSPRAVYAYRLRSESAAVCRTYSGKIDFSNVQCQYYIG